MSNSNPTTTRPAEQTETFPQATARVLVKIAGAVLLLLLVAGVVSGNISVLTNVVMIGLAVVLAVITLAGATVAEALYDLLLSRLSR